MLATELTPTNIDTFTQVGKVIIDFWAPWCGPCKAMSKTLDGIESVPIGKVNVEEYEELASRYNVQALPTLIFIEDGKEYDRVTGAVPVNVIEEKI